MGIVADKYTKDPVRRLRITGILAVLPIDRFTGRAIAARDFSVEIEGAGRPVRKPDGFFVFSGILSPPVTVRLSGRGFQEKLLRVPAETVNRVNPVLTVRMEPDRNYPFPARTLFLEGTLAENMRLSAALWQREGAYRLSADYRAGEGTAAVYRGAERNLTGCTFYMAREEDMPRMGSGGRDNDARRGGSGGRDNDARRGGSGGRDNDARRMESGDRDNDARRGGSGDRTEDKAADGERAAGNVQESGLSGEWIALGEPEDAACGRYRLNAPAARDYDKAGTFLLPAAAWETGQDAERYFFALGPAAEKGGNMTGGAGYKQGYDLRRGEGVKQEYRLLCRTEKHGVIKDYRIRLSAGEVFTKDFE